MSSPPDLPPTSPARPSRQSRGALIALSVLAAVLLIALAIFATQAGSPPAIGDLYTPGRNVAPQSTLPIVTTPTTLPTSTTAASPDTTPAPAPATSISDPPRLLTGQGAVLAKPTSPDQRAQSDPVHCRSLADQGWENVACGSVQVDGTRFTSLIEFRLLGADGFASRAYLFRQAADGTQAVVLEALDDAASRFNAGEVDAAFAPIEPNGKQDAIFTFLRRGGPLGVDDVAVDVVQLPTAEVTAHQELNVSSVTASSGELDTYSARGVSPSGPWVHDTIKFVKGAWWVVSEEVVANRDVPPSQFT